MIEKQLIDATANSTPLYTSQEWQKKTTPNFFKKIIGITRSNLAINIDSDLEKLESQHTLTDVSYFLPLKQLRSKVLSAINSGVLNAKEIKKYRAY